MAKRKILFVIDSLGAGGAERQLVYILERLDLERFRAVVLTLYNDATVPYHYGHAIIGLNIPIHSLNLPRSGGIARLMVGILRYVALAWRVRPHVVQGCLHTANLIVRLGRVLCPPHLLLTVAQNQQYSPGMLANERRTSVLSDRIIANSPHTYEILTNAGRLSPHKISTIYCGVDYQRFHHNSNAAESSNLRDGVSFLALMVGRVAPKKDHLTLLKAIALLRDDLPQGFKLLMIGHVFDQNVQFEIDAAIHTFELESIVVQTPATQDITPYYHAADVLVLPSMSESFGLVVVEAAAANTPSIVSQAANVLGFVEGGVNGWVFDTGKETDLARCLDEAINLDTTSRHQLGKHAALRAPRYDVDRMVADYVKLYE